MKQEIEQKELGMGNFQGYPSLLRQIKHRVSFAQQKAMYAANKELTMVKVGNIPIAQSMIAQLGNAPIELPIKHLSWTHNIILIQQVKNIQARYWYMIQCIIGHWQTRYLTEAIKLDYYGKHGALANNFDTTLPATEALEVKSLLKDPYIFDMLTFTDQYDERDIEIGLIKHVEKFLVEMGAGFAFMGRQCMHSLLLQNKHFIYEYNDRQFFF